jgi:hypothetical protein
LLLEDVILNMNDGLLEDSASHKHIEWGVKMMIMHDDGGAISLKAQVSQTYI